MRHIIPHTGNVEATADALRQALQRHGHRAMTTWDVKRPGTDPEVWLIPRDRTFAHGEFVRPGQRVVVEDDGSYRIEPVPVEAVAL